MRQKVQNRFALIMLCMMFKIAILSFLTIFSCADSLLVCQHKRGLHTGKSKACLVYDLAGCEQLSPQLSPGSDCLVDVILSHHCTTYTNCHIFSHSYTSPVTSSTTPVTSSSTTPVTSPVTSTPSTSTLVISILLPITSILLLISICIYFKQQQRPHQHLNESNVELQPVPVQPSTPPSPTSPSTPPPPRRTPRTSLPPKRFPL